MSLLLDYHPEGESRETLELMHDLPAEISFFCGLNQELNMQSYISVMI